MPRSEPLPEPWQSRLDEVWDELVDLDFYSRYVGEVKRDSQIKAEQWADSVLERVGRQRLTSDLFWSILAVLRGEGVSLPEALDCAARSTPELGG